MEESTLRLLLILIGVCILLGLYFFDKVKKQSNDVSNDDEIVKVQPIIVEEDVPVSSSQSDIPVADSVVAAEMFEQADVSNSPGALRVGDETTPVPTVDEPVVIQLIVAPKQSTQIEGVQLLNVFTQLNLEFGDMGIFHRYLREQGVERQLFHVANLMEPGTFPVGNMSEFNTKGLVFFFQADQALNASVSFDEMLETARGVAQSFDSELLVSNRQPLTFEAIDDIRQTLQDMSSL